MTSVLSFVGSLLPPHLRLYVLPIEDVERMGTQLTLTEVRRISKWQAEVDQNHYLPPARRVARQKGDAA